MADNHIIASKEETDLLYEMMNTYSKIMQGDNHVWQKNKFVYHTLMDKVLESREYHGRKKN